MAYQCRKCGETKPRTGFPPTDLTPPERHADVPVLYQALRLFDERRLATAVRRPADAGGPPGPAELDSGDGGHAAGATDPAAGADAEATGDSAGSRPPGPGGEEA